MRPARLLRLAAAAAVLAAARPARAATAELCPTVVFTGGEVPDLSEVEKKLVCGDPERDGWREIPVPQARYFLRTFLQQRGHHSPSFETRGRTLRVDAGPRSRIRELSGEGLPPGVDLGKRRKTRGRVLTPSELDRFDAWLTAELQSRGYGCPEVAVTADSRTGVLHARVERGPEHSIGDIEEARVEGLAPGVLRRYEAFVRGQPLDLRLLTLTSDRVVVEDLFFSAYYDLVCSEGKKLDIVQRVVPAPPRLVTTGVGVDTEGILIGRAAWKHARIGANASSIEANLYASFREQRLEAFSRIYPLASTRAHLLPRVEAKRQDETSFEAVTAEFALMPATSWDTRELRLELRAGPGYEYVRTLEGEGPDQARFLTFASELRVMSHLFEYYLGQPQTGWEAFLRTDSREAGFQSPVTAHRIRLTGTRLWNLGRYDPPLAVLGVRALAGTTWIRGEENVPEDLPPSMRFFLGGEADLRGFSRQQLPPDPQGFLTVAYQGLELRAGDVLPWYLQPFAFVDAAAASRDDFELGRNVFWSPGFGLRWGPPLGSFRVSLARGMTWRRSPDEPAADPRWQFYFSFGREF